jgi:hypothetical protein
MTEASGKSRHRRAVGFSKHSTGQKEGAQPLRVVGRQKRVFFARVPGGKPARTNHTFG